MLASDILVQADIMNYGNHCYIICGGIKNIMNLNFDFGDDISNSLIMEHYHVLEQKMIWIFEDDFPHVLISQIFNMQYPLLNQLSCVLT